MFEGFVRIPVCVGHRPSIVHGTRKGSFWVGGHAPHASQCPPESWEREGLILAKTAQTPAGLPGTSPIADENSGFREYCGALGHTVKGPPG